MYGAYGNQNTYFTKLRYWNAYSIGKIEVFTYIRNSVTDVRWTEFQLHKSDLFNNLTTFTCFY